MLTRIMLTTVLVGLTLGNAGRVAGDVARPTPHELTAIAATDGPRLWHHEEEFLRDPALRAAPEQVVILHLEPGPKRGNRLRNIIPYLFTETAPYTFCIPNDDPHLQSLELVREGSRGVVVHVPRSSRCKTRTVAAGLYQLVVEHDGSAIAAAGKKAFVHVPRFKGTVQVRDGQSSRSMEDLQAANAQSSFPSPCDPNSFNNPLVTFTAPNGMFINPNFLSTNKVQTTATAEVTFGWTICPDGSGNVLLANNFWSPGKVYFSSSGPPSTDTTIYAKTTPTPFNLTDLGNGQFTLAANFSGTLYPIVVGADNVLHWTAAGTPTVLTSVLKYYLSDAPVPPLQPGEVALFRGCNYDDSAGTWVFNTNVPNFGAFTLFFGTFDNQFASAKVGPQTSAVLFADANYGGQVQVITADTPCLNGTPLGTGASSLKITPYRDFLVATDACQNCNLSGLDLSGLNLAGGQFQGSTFTGANLTNTNLQSASLNNANVNGATTLLTGTNFLGALLRCTNFSAADLSQASFQLSGVITPVVTTDFSCRVDLTSATLNLSTFPLTQWRYFNLTGAKISGLAGATLSTTASPLNLSGVLFNSTDLHGAKLDGAILDRATAASGALISSQLIDANLNSVSLKKASLVNAVLQGANLDFTNLDSANLCSAFLDVSPATSKSASLQGAYLRNVNLSQAHLTGAFLKNADFYSTSTTATTTGCLSTDCGPTKSCASAVNAVLNSATFTGAYLSGVDFSGSTPQGVDFSGAFLVGANFTKANLSEDSNTGRTTNFSGAYLQGAAFTTPISVTDANFTNAYVSTAGAQLFMQLSSANLQFAGYQPPASPGIPGCVQFTPPHGTVVPTTNSTNTCPNGSAGPCGALPWPPPLIPLPSPGSCTGATTDFNWIIPPS